MAIIVEFDIDNTAFDEWPSDECQNLAPTGRHARK